MDNIFLIVFIVAVVYLLIQLERVRPKQQEGLMTKGDTTTIRESGRPEQRWPHIHQYNATQDDLDREQKQQVGQTFQADGHTYEIESFRIDTIHRLIAIGKLKKENT